MKKIKTLSFNTYKYDMNFKKEYIENFKLDLLSILYMANINVLKQDKNQELKLIKRVEDTFLYLNVLIDHKDTRPVEDKERFKEALFDELNALKDLYVGFKMEYLDIEDFNEWLKEQK
jgi:hypothetical protein